MTRKLDALDLIINALLDHEKRLDKIGERLERILRQALQEDVDPKLIDNLAGQC